jgi:hypothetical protein
VWITLIKLAKTLVPSAEFRNGMHLAG